MCHSTPDHLTTSVRTCVAAYEPVIRSLHNAVDLADTMSDLEVFLRDFLKIAKIRPAGKEGKEIVPTVADFVQLLKKHQYSFHKFLHQLCKNDKEVVGWYVEWAKKAALQFRQDTDAPSSNSGAGNLESSLQEMFQKLSPDKKNSITRLESVLKAPPSKNPALNKIMSSSTVADPLPAEQGASSPPSEFTTTEQGPGAYLDRWEDLLDKASLTPLSIDGKVKTKSARNVDVPAPNVNIVIEALGSNFRSLLGIRGLNW